MNREEINNHIAKTQFILAEQIEQRKMLGRKIKQTQSRLKGATRDILIQRFTLDLTKLQEQLKNVLTQEAWTKRTLQNTKNSLLFNSKGDIAYNPFKVLKSFEPA